MPSRPNQKSVEQLQAEVEELARRLEESEQILQAIQSGAVDALVVSAPDGDKIYTLHGAEHPFRIMVETMSEGAVALDGDGTILYCNKRLAEMLQLPLERVIGSHLASYVEPADSALFAALVAKGSQQCVKDEIALVTSGGKSLPVVFSCCAAEISGSDVISVVMTDISARKQAERTILRLNRLYALLSATNHAIVHAVAPLAIFREFCRVAVEVGGFRLAWVGLVEKGAEAIQVAAASGDTELLDGRLAVYAEWQGIRPVSETIRQGTFYICNDFYEDDLTRPWHEAAHAHGVYALASVAIKQEQEVVGALTVYAEEKDFFDPQQVALLQQIGAEISFALDTLHVSVLRTQAEQALREETVERLRAVEELRKNEQVLIHQGRHAALGEMIGNIAHQWRQPLNSLGLLVQQVPMYYALGEVDQVFLEETTRKAMKLIDHMSTTIDDFRNFFRPNKEKVDFDVSQEVVRTISLLEGSLSGKDISVEVDVKERPVAHGYPNEFSQALLNILINARDALIERRVAAPTVRVTVASEEGRAVVSVADNAGGIPDEILDKIFDPYFTTKGPQSGTGVGLFMSKTIIEKNMNGRLSVRNTDCGAEFRIEL